ncbi:hypothetical protein CsSME_00049924 [Camellia sinensis var. sinensis]
MRLKSFVHFSNYVTNWWTRFGSKAPKLTKFAIPIRSLTCNASGCERNWSTFEPIHTKKRNRLEHKRLNALVYVKYNTKLRKRSIRRRQTIDPILIDEIDSDDEWIAEKEDQVLPLDASWLDEEELFDAEAIRTVPITTYDRSVENRSTTTTINVDSSSNAKKRKVGEGSRNDIGKGKATRCTLVNEDMELEEVDGIDDGTYPIIDIAD